MWTASCLGCLCNQGNDRGDDPLKPAQPLWSGNAGFHLLDCPAAPDPIKVLDDYRFASTVFPDAS
jgi:hypothetical protein